jgi:hypothetical protein
MMRKKIVSVIVSLMLCGFVQQASAVTILDTINGASFNNNGVGNSVEDDAFFRQAVGVPFHSANAGTITDVTAFIAINSGPTGSVDIGIMANNVTVPSGIFLFHQVVSLSAVNPIVLSSLNWAISAGDFWLAAFAADSVTQGVWLHGANGNQPFATFNPSTGIWTIHTLDPVPQALISGNFSDAATPLPAALPLFATGLGALGLLGWRRKRNAKAAA